MPTSVSFCVPFLSIMFAVSAAADITIRGTTIDDATSSPMAGLTVSAEHLRPDRSGSAVPFSASTVTLADGTFVLELPDSGKDYSILVKDDNGLLLDGYTHIDEDTDLGSLRLAHDGECSGLVRQAGKELSGVDVVAEFRLRKTSCRHYTEAARTRTLADGTFEFGALAPGEYRCFVDDERFAPQRQELEIQDDFAYLELAVEQGCQIKGAVRTEDGTPVEGVVIMAGGRAREVTTDANGRYVISGLEKKSVSLSLQSDAYAIAAPSEARATFKTSTTAVCDIVVVPAAILDLVLVPEGGASRPTGVFVQLRGDGGWRDSHSLHVNVDEGVARCRGLRPGSYALHVHADGVWHDDAELDLTAGLVLTQQVTVVPTVDLSGTATDAGGAPVVGASIRLMGKVTGKGPSGGSYTSSFQTKSAKSDDDGVFVLSGVTPGSYQLEGDHDRFVETELELSVTAEKDQDVYLVLQNACTVEGRIEGADGKPVEDAEVSVIRVEKDDDAGSRSSVSRRYLEQEDSDADGRYVIGGIPAGSYELAVEHDDYLAAKQDVDIGPGTNSLSLIVLKAGLSISGTVVASDGAPIEDIQISVSGPIKALGRDHIWRNGETDDEGAFRVGGLAEGRYTVTVQEGRDTVSTLPNITAGTDDLFVSLGAKQTMTGRVVSVAGDALAGATISSQKRSPGRGRSFWGNRGDDEIQTDDTGAFTIELREGDAYSVTATLSPYLPATVPVDLTTDKGLPVASLEITMKMGNTIRGIVVREDDGEPVKGVGVRAGAGGWFGGFGRVSDDDAVKTDADGRFELKGVANGILDLVVYSSGDDYQQQVLAQERVMVKKPLMEGVRVELPPTGVIRGVCKDADGAPLADVPVILQAAGPPPFMRHAQTDAQGNFTFDSIPEGKYQAYATITEMDEEEDTDISQVMPRMIVEQVAVQAGETTKLELCEKKANENAPALAGSVSVNGTKLTTGSISFQPMPGEEDDRDQMAAAMRMFRQTRQAKISSNGVFEIKGLEAGDYTYRVAVSADEEDGESAASVSYNGTVSVVEEAQRLSIDITGVVLSGAVTSAAGEEEGVRVQLVPETAGVQEYILTRSTTTGADGRYAFDCVQPGAYKLRVQSEEFAYAAQDVEVAKVDVTLDVTLSPGVTLGGSITTPDGQPILQAGVVVLSEDGEDTLGFGFSSQGGRYDINPPLKKGSYLLLAFRDGYSIETHRVKLTKDSTWDAELEPGGSAEISVTNAAGEPVPGKYVEVRDQTGALVERCRNAAWATAGYWSAACSPPLDSDGKTTMKGLVPGTYTVSVENSESVATFSITALETTAVQLTL